MIVYFAPKKMI